MSQLERLTDLLKQADEHSASRCITDYDEATADNAAFLLENGVIVPPVKVGQTVYETQNVRKRIQEYQVISILCTDKGYSFSWILKDGKGIYSNVIGFTDSAIGKTVFLTKEEAEKALEERSEP